MIISDPDLLRTFRSPGRCEGCGKRCRVREGHHLWPVGRGFRLDIRINLIALGSTLAFQCECHTKHHNDGETREKFLATVAAREKTTPEEITEVIYLLRRLIKPSQRDLEQGLQSLSASAADLALRMIT